MINNDNGITRICKDLGRIKLVKKVFEEAKKADPGAMLLINDFNTSQAYEILIEGCLEAGVPISAIGIQSHQHQGYWGLEKLREVWRDFPISAASAFYRKYSDFRTPYASGN